MRYPVDYISIPQGYGNGHKGIDFGWYSVIHHHQPIYSVDDGYVIYAKYQTTGGNVVHIKHDNGFVSEYGHLQDVCVKVGQKVTMGQQIARMGATGKVTGEHLHFGLCKGSKITYTSADQWVNPFDYLEVYKGQVVNDKAKKQYGNQIKYHADEVIRYVYNVDDEGLVVYAAPRGRATGELLKAGTRVVVFDTDGHYSKIGENRWVWSSYLANKKPAVKTVTGVANPPLNVRNKPSTSGKVVGKLYNGDTVQVYKTKNGWAKVSREEERWTSGNYLK